MGRNSKKKKKTKGRIQSKDHSSFSTEDQEIISEEITVLEAIFQDDIKIISESSHTQFDINLRPYSNDIGNEDLTVTAHLQIRCLPGYPRKCPKIQVVQQKGLSKEDTDQLVSLLLDQANINAREKQVMIFNLVETAQEFLSGIVPPEQPLEIKEHQLKKEAALNSFSEGPYVYVPLDLFSDLCGDEASRGSVVAEAARENSNAPLSEQTVHSRPKRRNNSREITDNPNAITGNAKPELPFLTKHSSVSRKALNVNLDVVEEESDNHDDSELLSDYALQAAEDTMEKDNDSTVHEELSGKEPGEDTDSYDTDYESLSPTSVSSLNDGQTQKKDLLMINLLHMACASKGSLSHAFPEILSELYKLGMLSEQTRDLAAEPPTESVKAFAHAFEGDMFSSRIYQLWEAFNSFNDDKAAASNSRYLNDFEEIRFLGKGGFGNVVLCKNKLDGRQYAIKKIRLKDKSIDVNEKILREVATLSRLQHQHVVRYYQAWFETEYGNHKSDSAIGSRTEGFTSSCTSASANAKNAFGLVDEQETPYLYIQMEYCPRTLRHDFDSSNFAFDKDQTYTWHLFRQIVEGLAHIHSHGIIHRDLTPSNIFFGTRNDIKIGDFGLAKFLKLEQVDPDHYIPTEATGVSMDGTGQVGTFFYTAPEIEQRWPQINEKVDMYSLGVVFFEIWHPFSTAMERHVVLSDLKQKGAIPSSWAVKFPNQAAILKRLMSPIPSERPSATELLQQDLPPRMEDAWLNDVLRTIQSSDDTYVYDRVISTIFGMNRLTVNDHHEHSSNSKMTREVYSFTQYSEADSELRDNAIEVIKEIFKQHGAKRLEISPMRVLDGYHPINRRSVKVLTSGGDMLELCHELRTPFVSWTVANQRLSFKRYEISWVYRRAIGHSTPNRFLQGDFDIVGGEAPLTEAESIKVAVDITSRFSHLESIDIRLNHSHILEAVWSWVGITNEARQLVAELLSSIGSFHPQSTKRKSNWAFIRRQLLQELKLSEVIVDRLQTASLRFCGPDDGSVLARLRGALSPDKFTHKALEEISTLLNFLRSWNIENISLDVLMPPTEDYYRGLFFQMYLNEHNQGAASAGNLIALGGRYDYLLHQMSHEYKFSPPGAVGISLALEKILLHCPPDIRPSRIDPSINVLVCSRGGGGLLQERLDLVTELWQANIRAEFVPLSDPSLTEQYEYATEHDIKCLIIITEAGLSQSGLVRVRHLELKKDKDVERGEVVKFLLKAAGSIHNRDLKEWN